jgi:hypothetical protein
MIDIHLMDNWLNVIINPSKKGIKELASFLRSNKENVIRMYHGTSAKHNIFDEGLKPTTRNTAKSLQSATGFVYLSIYPSMAQNFGKISYPYDEIKVYQIEIPIKKLKADLDQLRNKRYWGKLDIGSTLSESLAYGYSARVKGKIFPYMIKEYNIK